VNASRWFSNCYLFNSYIINKHEAYSLFEH
jgi:hypothetical protein